MARRRSVRFLGFVDRQLRGPYRLWHHRHEFEAVDGRTRVRDVVHYAPPLGPLGELARVVLVRRDLDRIFDYRRVAVERLSANGDIASAA
jgi:ligand-binding SRPBCC domain-containing protein